MSQRYYSEIDAIRFISALLVAFFHLAYWSTLVGTTPNRAIGFSPDFGLFSEFSRFGWIGVEIFFVISGFVIANSANKGSATSFIWKRALRLYPAVWVCASLTFISWILIGREVDGDLVGRYIHSMLLLPNNESSYDWIDGVYWTLKYEISFYFAVFIVMLFPRFFSLSALACLMSVFSGAYLLMRLLLQFNVFPNITTPYFGVLSIDNNLATNILQFRNGCFFSLGIFMFMAAKRTLIKKLIPFFILSMLGGLVEVYIRVDEFNKSLHINDSPLIPMVMWFVSILLMLFLSLRKSSLNINSNLAKLLRELGLMTYPFYLLHAVVGGVVMRFLSMHLENGWVIFVFTLSAVLVMSFSVSRYVEPTIRHFLEKLQVKHTRQAQG
ncbi:acyltransferase family protein [Escherichia coli O141,141ab,141ac:H43]